MSSRPDGECVSRPDYVRGPTQASAQVLEESPPQRTRRRRGDLRDAAMRSERPTSIPSPRGGLSAMQLAMTIAAAARRQQQRDPDPCNEVVMPMMIDVAADTFMQDDTEGVLNRRTAGRGTRHQ